MEPAYTPPPLQSASFSGILAFLLSHRFFLAPSFSHSSPFSAFSLSPFPSFPLFLSLSLSTGPGIPSCGCKIDGASRDNCCSGTRFQTRVHLEYTWRKALPMVDGRSKGRAHSDFSFVKRFFGHDTVCYRSPIQPRVPVDTGYTESSRKSREYAKNVSPAGLQTDVSLPRMCYARSHRFWNYTFTMRFSMVEERISNSKWAPDR